MNTISVESVEKALDDKIRPQLALHNGDIKIENLADNVLYLRLLGACSGCPSANLTMENLVNEELLESFPEIKKISLVTGVSDNLINEAKAILKRRSR